MDAEEVVYWREYLREPRGELREDYRAAQITQAVYTFMSSFGKDSKPINLEQCMLNFEESEPVSSTGQTAEKAMQTVAAIASAFGKGVKPFTQKMMEKLGAVAAAPVDGSPNG